MNRIDFKKYIVKETGELHKNKSLAKEKYKSAEGIVVKEFYTEEETKELSHLNYVSGIAPYLRGPYATMYIQRPWTIRQRHN